MNNWADACVRNVITLLHDMQVPGLAADLQRIRASIGLDDLEVMRSEHADQLATDIAGSENLDQLLALLHVFAETLGVQHCTVHLSAEIVPGTFPVRVLTTYPDIWTERYVDRRYAFIDPVISACKTRSAAFYWDELSASSALVRAFWRDAEMHGVGSSGYSVPIGLERGDVISVSMTSTLGPSELRAVIAPLESDLFVLALHLTEAFDRVLAVRRPSALHPTDDQMFILHAIAVGADLDELKDRPFQYGSYATLKRSICTLFQTRTLAQAAVIAARIGLFDSPPLTRSDILSHAAARIDLHPEEPADDRPSPLVPPVRPFAVGPLRLLAPDPAQWEPT